MKDHTILTHEEPLSGGALLVHDLKAPFGKSGTKESFQHVVEDAVGHQTDDNDFAVAAGERAREGYENGTASAFAKVAKIVRTNRQPIIRLKHLDDYDSMLFIAGWDQEAEKTRVQMWWTDGERCELRRDVHVNV